MRVRTFVGILVGLVVVVFASYLTHLNIDLLHQRFEVSESSSVPLYGAVVVVFLAGFLPVVTVLLVQTLRRDLDRRRGRRRAREDDRRRSALRRALDYSADGRWRRATAELEAVLSERPEEFHALLHLGSAQRAMGRFEEAIETHRRASVLYPQSAAILYELASDYEADAQPEVAGQIHDRLLRDFNDLGQRILEQRRDLAAKRKDWEEALQQQDRIDALLKGSDDEQTEPLPERLRIGLAYERALLELERDRPEQAIEGFEQILDRAPEFVPAGIMMGEAHLSCEREGAALETWRRGFMETGDPTFLQRIEDHFIERADPMRAIETLHSILAAAENDLMPRYSLGRLYFRLEMPEEALKALLAIESRVGHSPMYHSLLARLFDRTGQADRARASRDESAAQLGLESCEYICRVCRSGSDSWRARCDNCGEWGSLAMDFVEATVPEEADRAVAKWQAYENMPRAGGEGSGE